MEDLQKYKQGLKAYRNGFGVGLLIGTGICLFLGKPIFALPIILGMVFGSVFYERNLNKNGTDK